MEGLDSGSWNGREMAAVAGQESETQLCNNCRKDIPLANFTIHEIHCSRNIGVCPLCKESFPKAELRAHQEQEHAQIVCKCSMRMDRGLLQDHVAFECPLRPVACQHCDIELAFCKLQDHEDYCGARTERCGRCNRNIMLRELKTHPIDCGKKAGAGEPGGQAKPPFNPEAPWRNVQTIRNVLRPDSAGESPLRGSRFLESQLHSWVSGDQLPGEPGWRNRGASQPDHNRACPEKAAPPLSPGDGESDYNLDYLLALSLQQENSFGQRSVAELQRELWKNICPPQAGPADHCGKAKNSRDPSQDLLRAANNLNRPKTETLLPCEFCEELYPEGDLILHQTGCNPASALASFSKRSSLVPPAESRSSLWGELPGSRSAGTGETLPPQHGMQDSLLLPCEFCGLQLEEEILFHHQDQCDLRPATAPSSGGTPALSGSPVPESSLRTESPDLLRRPIRHQGELPPHYLEQLQQKPPFQPAPRSYSQVAARRIQLATPNNLREDPVALSRARKPQNLGDGEGRSPGRSPSDPVAAPLPARYPSSDFAPSTYIPSFPLALPTRPSIRQEGGPRAASPPRFNNAAKAKPWQVKSADPDRE
ncbi:TRAF-type zinc finger domain-containing protein 1 isoform X1 [Thamnophis elegans]|uniref:TRAF-type zinc finger domain-containing protein 1 isoform X1 n=2 Tax=Thamnophis elegans TaxID=35005 RepID=UPI0013773517|nr:TRAF-type zinc finger domain-containing protein 1 isoform X1 [Thamnophis elegans]